MHENEKMLKMKGSREKAFQMQELAGVKMLRWGVYRTSGDKKTRYLEPRKYREAEGRENKKSQRSPNDRGPTGRSYLLGFHF